MDQHKAQTLHVGPWYRSKVRGKQRIKTSFYISGPSVGMVVTDFDPKDRSARSQAFISTRDEHGELGARLIDEYVYPLTTLMTLDERCEWWIKAFMDSWPVISTLPEVQRYLDPTLCTPPTPPVAPAPHQVGRVAEAEHATLHLPAPAHTQVREMFLHDADLTELYQRYQVTHDLFSDQELRRLEYWRWCVQHGLQS